MKYLFSLENVLLKITHARLNLNCGLTPRLNKLSTKDFHFADK